jgi:hypothetical protein
MHCPICGRNIIDKIYKEKHHLVPRCEGGKEKVIVCIDCGNQIHELFTVHELRDKFDTIEKLKANEKIQTWIKWIRTKRFGICMKAKKKR